MRESKIEDAVCRYAKSQGVLTMKFVSPARRSVPDRIFFYKGRTWLIEFKRPGGKTTSGQDREIQRLRDQGIRVFVCDGVEVGKSLIRSEMRRA